MNKSESIAEIAKALSKVQGKIKNAIKDSKNPFFKSSYADLASCVDACRHELAENGIAVVQPTKATDNGKVIIETMLIHSSGEWIMGELALKPVKDDPQSVGSAITYARRYGLCAMVGIAPDDDDGNAASGRNGNHETTLPIKDTIQDESHAESPKTKEARAKAADPLNNKYLNGKWKDVICCYGKKEGPLRGKKLGVLPRKDLAFLRDSYKPTPWNGTISADSIELRLALDAYAIERSVEKEREEVVQEAPEMHSQDQEWDANEEPVTPFK